MAENLIGNFMGNAKGMTKNPLGIIALFISLIYGFACLVLGTSISNLKTEDERLPLIWFIIAFPLIILFAFVFLVMKHHGKLYSPSDYGDNESFLKTIEGSQKFEPIQIELTNTNLDQAPKGSDLVKKSEDLNLNKGIFSPLTKENVRLFNEYYHQFLKMIDKKPYNNQFKQLAFGAQAPEYFTALLVLKEEALKVPNTSSNELIIIRITEDNLGVLNLIAIGKDIIENDPIRFAEKVMIYIDNLYKNKLKGEFLTKLL